MRLPRLTISQMMAVVVILAVALWALRLRQLADGYRRMAWFHTSLANETLMEVSGYEYEKNHERKVAQARAVAAYHFNLARSYEAVALRPWQSPPDDPLAAQAWRSAGPDTQIQSVRTLTQAPQ
jgi:hypothetical protein